MTLKKKLAIALCSAFALAPVAYAQTGGAVEGTTSPQSGNQTDMGTDGTSNSKAGSGSSNSGTSGGSSHSGTSSSGSSSSGKSGSSSGSSGSGSASGGSSGSGAAGSGSSSGSSSSGASGSGASSGGSGSGAAGSGTSGSGASSGTSGSGASHGASASSPSSSGSTGSSASTAATKPTSSAATGDSFDAKLKGKSVYNENDEKVGDVKDLVMSSDGKVTHVILGVGGFVGVGEHPVAIPYEEINQNGDKLTLRGYTKDQLKEMPAYEYPKDDRAPASAPAKSGTSPMGPR